MTLKTNTEYNQDYRVTSNSIVVKKYQSKFPNKKVVKSD